MCGIVGIYSHEPVAAELYDSLIHLQHRGQDAAGILTSEERFYSKHGLGLVREIFTPQDMLPLKGNMCRGTRYLCSTRLIFCYCQPGHRQRIRCVPRSAPYSTTGLG